MVDVPTQVAAYRADYRAEKVRPGYDGRLHLTATTSVGAGALVACLLFVRDLTWLELSVVPLTYVFANLVEYLAHRHLMHKMVAPLSFLYRRHAAEHHRFFTQECMVVGSTRDFAAVIFPLKVSFFFLGLVAAPSGLVVGWLLGSNAGWLFAATAVAYYQSYEALHLMAHLDPESPLGRRGVVRAIRHHHGIHHDTRRMRKANFNITVPLWDLLLGTLDHQWRPGE